MMLGKNKCSSLFTFSSNLLLHIFISRLDTSVNDDCEDYVEKEKAKRNLFGGYFSFLLKEK